MEVEEVVKTLSEEVEVAIVHGQLGIPTTRRARLIHNPVVLLLEDSLSEVEVEEEDDDKDEDDEVEATEEEDSVAVGIEEVDEDVDVVAAHRLHHDPVHACFLLSQI